MLGLAQELKKSFTLLFEDQDAPGENPFVHWVLFNIPAQNPNHTGKIDLSQGIPNTPAYGMRHGMNSFEIKGYKGPCPPKTGKHAGVHRYNFWLFALDKKLDLLQGATRDQVRTAMEGHILGRAAHLVGIYTRK